MRYALVIDAVRDNATLILIGDKDQLPSLICPALVAGGPEQRAELVGSCDVTVVADILRGGRLLFCLGVFAIPAPDLEFSPVFAHGYQDTIY